MNHVKTFIFIFIFYLAWPFYQAMDYIFVQPFAELPDILNYFASIFSYNWLMVNILMALKIPFLQRLLPYDFRIRLHIITSLGITLFLIWHASYYLFINPKQINLATWGLMISFPTLLLFSMTWVFIPGKKQKSYDVLKTIHKGLYVLLAFIAFIHINDAKIIGTASQASSFWFQFIFYLACAAFLYTRIRNRLLPISEVIEVKDLGNIIKLRLSKNKRLKYKAGQFAFLRFSHPDLKGEEHPFSFISEEQDERIEFAIKKAGDFTNKLVNLLPGDQVKINGGFGSFYPKTTKKTLVLIGTGIGAAPIISILRSLAGKSYSRKIICFLAVPTLKDLIIPEELGSLKKRLTGLTLNLLVSDQGAPRISPDFLKINLGDIHECEFYLCSSNKVLKSMLHYLKLIGASKKFIHYEKFNLN